MVLQPVTAFRRIWFFLNLQLQVWETSLYSVMSQGRLRLLFQRSGFLILSRENFRWSFYHDFKIFPLFKFFTSGLGLKNLKKNFLNYSSNIEICTTLNILVRSDPGAHLLFWIITILWVTADVANFLRVSTYLYSQYCALLGLIILRVLSYLLYLFFL